MEAQTGAGRGSEGGAEEPPGRKMAPSQSSAPCQGFAISQLPHGSRRGLFSSALTSLNSERDSRASFCKLHFRRAFRIRDHSKRTGVQQNDQAHEKSL